MTDLRSKPFFLTDEQIAWVKKQLEGMTLQEKAGQLFFVNASGYKPEVLDELVRDYAVGGTLFRPMMTFEELKARYAELDKIARFPLLKASNLESGGNGIVSDGVLFSSQVGVSAAGDDTAEKFARACAYEGAKAGINITFSPVSDKSVNYLNPIIPTRSFGTDQEKVEKYTRRYVEVIQAAGIAASAKHFPGDGIDFRDQHLHPTYNTLSKDEWYDSFGRIYKGMIDAGLLSVMVGHICAPAVQMDINPELTPEKCLPGCLSPELLQGVLRGRLGFNGMIVTDATIMTGFAVAMERSRAIPWAIEAGCDMLCFSTDIYEDIQFILDGVKDGILSEKRLDEAVTRILALKAAVACKTPKASEVPVREWAKEAADRAVTLVKDTREVLPVTREKYDTVRIISKGNDNIPGGGSIKEYFLERFKKAGLEAYIYEPSFKDDLGTVADLDRRVLNVYLCNMEDISNNTTTRLFWFKKHAIDIPRNIFEQGNLFISFAYPYHLIDVPRVSAYINAYTGNAECVEAVADKILGQSEFKGENPVDPFCGLIDTRI